jgi:hypothetical protein
MYPNSQHVDEPTMTDLRGILPGQRPPVDARVLDEPTSEVPIIKPAGTVETDPEPEAEEAVAETEAEYVEEAEQPEPTLEATYVEATVETEAEPEVEPETAEALVEDEPADFVTEPWSAAQTAPPEPAFTPPVVPEFGTDITAQPPASEMAKMSWAPSPPPGLVPVSDTSEIEPVAEVEVTEPEVTEPEAVEPEAVEPETVEPEAVEPEAVEVTEPEVTEPEAIEAEEIEAEVAEPEPIAIDEPAPAVVSHAPGEVSETAIAVWSDEAAQDLRDKWRELQVQFIDDPNVAVDGAKGLVTEAVRELADTLLAAQAELDPFRGGDRVDTETMRVAMRRYREFLDRVLAL